MTHVLNRSSESPSSPFVYGAIDDPAVKSAERVCSITCRFPIIEKGGLKLVVKSQLSPGEIQISSQIPKHPNLVQVFGVNEEGDLLIEYIPGESPTQKSFLKLPKDERISAVQSVLRQIALALQALEEKKIVYADLKPANIQVDHFLDCERRAVLFDFGVSFPIGEGPRDRRSLGTTGYIAPEIQHEECRLDNKIDVYSFGQLIPSIITDGGICVEFDDSDFFEQLIRFGASETQANDALDLARRCTLLSPEQRPSFEELLQHPFITGVGATECDCSLA